MLLLLLFVFENVQKFPYKDARLFERIKLRKWYFISHKRMKLYLKNEKNEQHSTVRRAHMQ